MRWKLLVLVSFVAALVASGLWSAFTIVFFESAGELAAHGWLLLASTFLPLIVAVSASLFIYRHTATRRKLQALLTAIFILLLTLAMYTCAMAWQSRHIYRYTQLRPSTQAETQYAR